MLRQSVDPKTTFPRPVWYPTAEIVERSRLQQFCRAHRIPSFEALHRRAADDPAWFWDAVLRDLGIVFQTPYTRVLDASAGLPFARWCVGGRLNITQSLLDRHLGTSAELKPALCFEDESGTQLTLSYRELFEQVQATAAGLRQLGVRPGDTVGVMMPLVPEVVVAMLAILRIGGIFVPLFSGFGADAAASRLENASARWLITADGTLRRGKPAFILPVAEQVARRLEKTVGRTRLIVLPRLGSTVSPEHIPFSRLASASGDGSAEILNAEAPMMLIYTSGTTGKPKAAVHTHCGFPVKAAQDLLHGFDFQPDERLCWITDMGWMMGPWLVFGPLLLGGTMVLYDGAPDFPSAGRLWKLCQTLQITTLGVSPTLIRALMNSPPPPDAQIATVRKFGSTGEPWNPDPWMWLFDGVGRRHRPILNYSGGTEISGGILCGNVVSPLVPCAFAGPLPGMVADVVDDHGRPVTGRVGELVLRQPWLGQTRGFWNDCERYLATYFHRGHDLWVHGDFARVDPDGQWYILGRSDDTLKIAGKRLGPAEVESVLVGDPAVAEAIAIGVPDDLKGEALVCLCVLRPDHTPEGDLAARLTALIARELGKPLAPREIRFVPELPKTRNGKLMRRIARAALLGQPLGDTTALDNPASLTALAPAAPASPTPVPPENS